MKLSPGAKIIYGITNLSDQFECRIFNDVKWRQYIQNMWAHEVALATMGGAYLDQGNGLQSLAVM